MKYFSAVQLAALSAALFFGGTTNLQAGAFGVCGPGPNWVDNCQAGTLTLNQWTATGTVDGTTVTLTGLGSIYRGPASNGHFDTKLLALSLFGTGFDLRLNSAFASVGGVTQQASGNLADSFFDVFFELDITNGPKLHNVDPVHLTDNNIDSFPDLGSAVFTGTIPLYDSLGAPVANLTFASHSYGAVSNFDPAPAPEPSTVLIFSSGLALLLIARGRRA